MSEKLCFSVGFILLLSLSQLAHAQEKYGLQLIGNDKDKSTTSINYRKSFSDTIHRNQELDRFFSKLQSKGYVFAHVDSVRYDSLNMQVFYNPSTIITWLKLDAGNINPTILSDIKFKESKYEQRLLNIKELNTIFSSLLKYAENNGYPFAVVKLENLGINDNQVSASLFLQLNKYYTIDSVRLRGSKVVSEQYLSAYLGIKEGSPYNESLIQEIATRLEELPFLREKDAAKVIFKENHAELNLYPEKRNANQFDGLVGIQPQSNGQKTQLIGQAKLSLHNAFKRAELLNINLKLQPNSTRDIELSFLYPFLLSSPFGIDLDLQIRKQDTSFSQFAAELGVFYLFKGMNYLKVFYKTNSSNLLSTKGIQIVNSLSDYVDMNMQEYGLGLNYEKLDYRLNPTKGYVINTSISAGNRQIRKNANLNEQLYDSLQLSSTQYRMQLQTDRYFKIISRHVLNIGISSGMIVADKLFVNDLFRIGGVNDLRGFDEQSILASLYLMYKLEYRYILERNAYFSFFYNQSFYEMKRKGIKVSDNPYGFGVGINFQTALGIFTVSYAIGKEFSNPLSFQNGKIHFGIINYF